GRVEERRAQQVRDVAGQRVDRSLVPIQRDGRVAALGGLHPVRLREPGTQVGGPAAEGGGGQGARGRGTVRAGERLQEVGPGEGRLVRVALDLAQRDRSLGEVSVAPLDRVARVLPALVGQATAGAVDVVDEPVAVAVAVLGQPGQGVAERGQQSGDL